MGYTMLKNYPIQRNYSDNTLEQNVLIFLRESCEGLRFDKSKKIKIDDDKDIDTDGRSIKEHQIPYNMEKDIDRLCLENAVCRFLKSGSKEDAFDVYFCYLEMFVGEYEKTRRMIELLSEFEANGSGLLMKHRDHYSHSVYVFCLGMAIYESNSKYREKYKKFYNIKDEHEAACHYLEYWGLASLFHDIGYPFELPFEQTYSYFEVNDNVQKKRGDIQRPFIVYSELEFFVTIGEKELEKIKKILVTDREFKKTNELFAYILTERLKEVYGVDEQQMLNYLRNKPVKPNMFGYYMDHAFFSATVLFKKMFCEMGCELKKEHLDSLTAILMHNSLYKFCIANPYMDPENPNMHKSYKKDGNKPFKAEIHPLAYMLMLCDELQCWDRTAYGRNSKKELHPMECDFDFSDNGIKAVYIFDEKEIGKINYFKNKYIEWLQMSSENKKENTKPSLKEYSSMFIKENGISKFQKDIEKIVDLTDCGFLVDTGIRANVHASNKSYLSGSNFLNLYNFAIVLNGRWETADWKKAKQSGQVEEFINKEDDFIDSFKSLSLEYKLSNINQAKSFAKYMDEIGCFYTDKSVDFEMVEEFTEEDLIKIGPMEHCRWLQEHYDMGWTYGNPDKKERDLLRQHKDMIPGVDRLEVVSEEEAVKNYERLDKEEQDKDTEPMECMLALLKKYDGLRIYRF